MPNYQLYLSVLPFLLTLFTLFLTTSINASPLTVSEPSLEFASANEQCRPDVPALQINVADCLVAVSHLPVSIRQTTFHKIPPYDAFGLPKWGRWRSCAIRVQLGLGWEKDEGTWRQVREMALKVTKDCVLPEQRHLTTGGIGIVGETDGIQVDIYRN